MDEGILSRVFEDSQGKLVGFFGALPRRMTVQGKVIRLAFGSNFVVDPESRVSMAAIQLVRAFMKGTQDISITDSGNEMSRQLLRSLGFSVVPIYSLQWARPLRPAQYAVKAIARMKKKRTIAVMGSVAKPICMVADAVATGAGFSPYRQKLKTFAAEELSTAAQLQCLTEVPSKNWLLPEYDKESLDWVIDFISERKVFGDLRKRLVRDKDGKTAGWYVYSDGWDGVGEVLQIGAQSSSVGMVLDHLFYDAWKRGLVGIHGRMEPQFMSELTMRSCFFLRHGSWTLAQSSKPELMALLQSGTAFFSRLDGEWVFRHGSVEL